MEVECQASSENTGTTKKKKLVKLKISCYGLL